MLNGFGGLNNLYNMKEENDEAAASLKYILGRFTVKEVTENGVQGYRIYDKYDFKMLLLLTFENQQKNYT